MAAVINEPLIEFSLKKETPALQASKKTGTGVTTGAVCQQNFDSIAKRCLRKEAYYLEKHLKIYVSWSMFSLNGECVPKKE